MRITYMNERQTFTKVLVDVRVPTEENVAELLIKDAYGPLVQKHQMLFWRRPAGTRPIAFALWLELDGGQQRVLVGYVTT